MLGMTTWTTEAVIAASNEWTWVPDDAQRVQTEELLVVGYPDHYEVPTSARVFGSGRDPAELMDEVDRITRGFGRDEVWWIVSDTTRPAALEDALLSRGGAVTERADILAVPIADGLPDLGVPPGVEVRRVRDERTLRDALGIESDAFQSKPVPQGRIPHSLAEVEGGLADDSSGRVVAYIEGVPAATGGWTLARDVCRLWGAGTATALRGRGAYRAVLAERLRIGRDRGATLGLTHGRIDTSSPILRRVGFVRYGEQRHVHVEVPGA
jgi:hypothetical protein